MTMIGQIISAFTGLRTTLIAVAVASAVSFGAGYRLADVLWKGYAARKELENAIAINDALTKNQKAGQDAAEETAVAETANDAVEQDTPVNSTGAAIPVDVLRGLAKLR
jgi:hypothetical protein